MRASVLINCVCQHCQVGSGDLFILSRLFVRSMSKSIQSDSLDEREWNNVGGSGDTGDNVGGPGDTGDGVGGSKDRVKIEDDDEAMGVESAEKKK